MSLENLNLESSDIEESELDRLLSGVPDSTANVNALQHAKVDEDTSEEETPFSFDTDVNLDDILANTDDEEPSKKNKTKEPVVVEDPSDEDEDEKPVVETKKVVTAKAAKADELSESALKQITDFYIEQGYWKDFEGRDEITYDADTFQDLLVKQNEELAKEKFEEVLDRVGPVGKAIIDHIEKGGKADEIIDLFKEQKQTTEFVPETTDEKKQYIAEYYHKVHGWSVEKIKRLVNSAEVDDTLDEEVTDIKSAYDKHYEREHLRIAEEREEYVANQKKIAEKFENDFTNEIQSRKISDKDKQLLKDVVLNYDQKLPDGTKVNKFYLKFVEMQNDLSKYVDFVQYVLDPDKFVNKIKKAEETKATTKAFFKIKGNDAVSNKTGSAHMPVSSSKDVEDFKWG